MSLDDGQASLPQPHSSSTTAAVPAGQPPAPTAATADNVVRTHARHRAEPANAELRAEFYRAALSYYSSAASSGSCAFHDPLTPGVEPELIGVFSLPDLHEPSVARFLDLLEKQWLQCEICLDTYHFAKMDFKATYSEVYGADVVRGFFDRMHHWNAERQRTVLEHFLNDYHATVHIDKMTFRRLRKTVTCTLSDIWRFPETLQNKVLDKMWAEVLGILNSGRHATPLQIDSEIVDAGAILAVGHADQIVRTWARGAMRQANAPLDLKQVESYKTVIGIISEYFTLLWRTAQWDPTFNYTHDPTELWKAITLICRQLTDGSFEDLTHAERLGAISLCTAAIERLPHAGEDFWDVLWLLETLIRLRPGVSTNVDTQDKKRFVFESITENPVFIAGITDPDFVRENPIATSWFFKLVMTGVMCDPAPNPADEILELALAVSSSWCPAAIAAVEDVAFQLSKSLLVGKGTFVSFRLAERMGELFLTRGQANSKSSESPLAFIARMLQSNPPADCMSFARRCLSFLSETFFKAVSEDSLNTQTFVEALACIDAALTVGFRWAQVADKTLVTAFIEEALSVAELALELLASRSELVGQDYAKPLLALSQPLVQCFLCRDSKLQTMAFGITRGLLGLFKRLHVELDSAVSLKLKRLALGELRSTLSQQQKDAIAGWISLQQTPARRSPTPDELLIVGSSPPPAIEDLTRDSDQDLGRNPVQDLTRYSDDDDLTDESDESMEDILLESAKSKSVHSLSDSFNINPLKRVAPRPKGQHSLDGFVSTGPEVLSVWEKLARDTSAGKLDGPIARGGSAFSIARKPLKPTVPKRSSKLQKLREEAAEELGKVRGGVKSRGAKPNEVVAPPSRMPQLPYQGPSGIGGGGGGEVTFVSREHSNFAPSDRAPSTLLLDNRGKSISQLPAKRGVPVRTPGGENKPPPPLRTLSTLYEHVLSWDFEAKGDKPPDFPFKLTSIPNLFDKDRAYAATFEPLLILECWEQMQKSRDEMFAEDKVGIKLSAVQMVDNFHDLTLSSAGQDMRLRGFSEHDVLIMTAVDKRGGPSPAKFLCKVNTVSFKGDEAVIQARAYVGKTPSLMPALCINSKWHAIRTYSLTTAVREYSSLCTLPSLALKEDILSPQKVPKPAPKTNEVRTMMDRYGLNEPQAAAISGALARKSGFTLIQGPPGTGKTKTILGLISAFLSERFVIKVPGQAKSPKTNRLLCCAPSNAAIDEIVRRLKFGISDGSGGIFKPSIVRIGSAEAIHSSVRDVTLDALVEKHADKALANNAAAATDGDDKQEAIRERMTVMKDEREKLRALSNEDDIDGTTAADLQSKIAAIGKKLAGLHEQLMKEKATRSTAALAREKQKRMLKRKILMDADVILTTLSGAGSDQLGDIPELSFPTVIIDEAAQSVELSTLVPLRYGAKRCILVGDPQQLPPTVLSQVGQAQRYEQSLFQRIMNVNPDAPYLLSISYRMHPEISSYVSRAFYGGRLQDAPNMLRLTTAPWHSDPLYPPYQLVNAHAGREQTGRGHSYTNPEEARLCVDLVETLCARYPGYQFAGKIGVITFYKKQVRAIKDLLFRRGWSKDVMQNLDINTVDGFQGQEKEIIILSCVRANNTHVGFISDVRRLNVAMSRAKSSLIVLGHVDTLRTHQVWRQLVDDAVDRKLVVRSSDRIFDLRPAGGAGGPLNLLPEASQEEGGPKRKNRDGPDSKPPTKKQRGDR